jgi:hypothetical protein
VTLRDEIRDGLRQAVGLLAEGVTWEWRQRTTAIDDPPAFGPWIVLTARQMDRREGIEVDTRTGVLVSREVVVLTAAADDEPAIGDQAQSGGKVYAVAARATTGIGLYRLEIHRDLPWAGSADRGQA